MMISREQIRMARAALGWGLKILAEKSGVSGNTINRYENGADAYGETLAKLQRTLENAGVIFIDEDDDAGVGVRLRKRSID